MADYGKPLVNIPGIRPVGSCAKDSGGGNMKRNPRVARTNVNIPKMPGSNTKSLGPATSAPLGDTYKTR